MGPLPASTPWAPQRPGVRGFLAHRVWVHQRTVRVQLESFRRQPSHLSGRSHYRWSRPVFPPGLSGDRVDVRRLEIPDPGGPVSGGGRFSHASVQCLLLGSAGGSGTDAPVLPCHLAPSCVGDSLAGPTDPLQTSVPRARCLSHAGRSRTCWTTSGAGGWLTTG